jgi:hypothetical protein
MPRRHGCAASALAARSAGPELREARRRAPRARHLAAGMPPAERVTMPAKFPRPAPLPLRPAARRRLRAALPVALAGGLAACTTSLESSTSYTGSASAKSIQIGGYTTEPSGWVYTQVLTSLGVGARDAGATWQSIGAFQASSSGTHSGSRDYYPWSGTLTNFTNATWPVGGVARVRVLYKIGSDLTTSFTFDDIGCLLEDPSETFEERAIRCQSHDSGHLHLVDEDPVTASSRDYISLRETPRAVFMGTVLDPGADYYAVVDSGSTRTTLAAWQAVNGFTTTGGAQPGYDPVVTATYWNHGDLELGRHMNCVKKTTSAALACYVTNYGDPTTVGPGPGDDLGRSLAAAVARDPDGVVATVAMEYRPGAATNKVTFFAFDDTGARVTRVALDSEGLKTLPGACISCHGGRFNSSTDSVAGGHFLPFDVDNFTYSTTAGFTLAAQQDSFRALNKLVASAGPTPAITELINGWYHNDLGTAGPDQDTDFVPTGWSGQEVTYREVVKPYCRGCHVTLDDAAAAPAITDFNSYAELNGLRFTAMNRVCELHDMPHAEVTRKRFWQSPARGHFIGEFNLPTACN